MHSSAFYLPPAPTQTQNYENQNFKAFRPLVYCYEEHLALNGYSPPWLDLLWFGKASCFCTTGNKKDPKSLTSHHVKNSISWSHFKNHYQLYSGKMPFWPEIVGWRVSQGHRRWGSFLLEYCMCRRVQAGADARAQVPVPEAGRADHVSDFPENRTHVNTTSFCACHRAQISKADKTAFGFQRCHLCDTAWQWSCFGVSVSSETEREEFLGWYEDSRRPSSGWGLSMCRSVQCLTLSKHSVLILWLNHMNQDRHPALTECPFNATYCSKCFIFLFIEKIFLF